MKVGKEGREGRKEGREGRKELREDALTRKVLKQRLADYKYCK